MKHFGEVPANSVLPIPFATYGNSSPASITMSGFAVTDIEIYKNGSTTQRASDNGYTLLDTDGTDFDGITGIHGFSIDLADNSDASFYTVGAFFDVVVSSITVDGLTVSFVAASFRIKPAESSAGVAKVDVTHFGGTAGTFASGLPSVDTTKISGDAAAADNAESFFDGTGYAGTGNTIPTVTTLTNDPAGVTTLLARLGAWTGSGLNTVLGAFRALAAKATGLTPSDLSTGTTFDNTTDSLESGRDNIGTAGAGLTAVLAYLTSGTIELNNPHLDEETLALRNGRYYGSTGSTPPTWTVAKNYATATSVVLVIHKKDDVSVKYKTITATVSSATLITVTDFMMGSYTNTFSFDEESVPQVFECRYDLVASWGGNYESIDAGSCFIYDQPTP